MQMAFIWPPASPGPRDLTASNSDWSGYSCSRPVSRYAKTEVSRRRKQEEQLRPVGRYFVSSSTVRSRAVSLSETRDANSSTLSLIPSRVDSGENSSDIVSRRTNARSSSSVI